MNRKTIFIIIAILILFSAWSPWINNQNLRARILQEKGSIDGTMDKDGKLVCDYKVQWMPFGRYVASCEGGYYVPFWKTIYQLKSVIIE